MAITACFFRKPVPTFRVELQSALIWCKNTPLYVQLAACSVEHRQIGHICSVIHINTQYIATCRISDSKALKTRVFRKHGSTFRVE